MKIGTDISVLAEPGRPDSSVLAEHLALADLAEPLGFDSLFSLEHHFTGYSMSPSPLQLLAYYAAKTSRITLGTCVIVLPWQDPIRVAEQIAYLDLLCRGRCIFGFGRGAASVEYAGFRVPMEEARARFAEAAQLVTKALRDEVFEWDGEFYKIPRMSIRPRPMSNPERRFYASSVSPESAEIMAKLGFGMMVVMQNEWKRAAADIESFRKVAISIGHTPSPPIILTNVSCAPTRAEAHGRAMQYLGAKWDSIDAHYGFSDGHLANVKGYESYGKIAKTYGKMKDPAEREKMTNFYVSIQIAGTADDCIQQLGELQRLTGTDHVVCDFSYGRMPPDKAGSTCAISPSGSCRSCNATLPSRVRSSRPSARASAATTFSFQPDGPVVNRSSMCQMLSGLWSGMGRVQGSQWWQREPESVSTAVAAW